MIYTGFTVRKCVTVTLLGVQLNRGTSCHLILGCVDHTCVTYLVEKHMYFIHMDQNPMNENPNATTWCIHTLAKTVRIVINPFFEAKMRSALELSTSDVMISVHRDFI